MTMAIFDKLIHICRSYTNTQYPGGYPEVNKFNISDFVLNELIPIIGTNPYPLSELELLVSTVLWYRPSHICDWGTHIGKATRIFYETVQAFSLKTHLISIDLPEHIAHLEHPHADRGKLVRHLPKIKLLLGDGVTTSLSYLKHLAKGNIRPLFFIDGDHEYISVQRELKKIHETYPSAVIIAHDTFNQTRESGYNIGPYKAITEFIKFTGQYKSYSTHFGLPGMTVLIPKFHEK